MGDCRVGSKTTVKKKYENKLTAASREAGIHFRAAAFTKKPRGGRVTVAQPRAKLYVGNIQDVTTRAGSWQDTDVVVQRWMEPRAKMETHTAQDDNHRSGTTPSCRSRHQSAGLHARRKDCMQGYFSYHSSLLFRDPLRSLWKPGVPYPVHGRVLVEIQRPRSLHRKAVIQLNIKRNRQNQSKHLQTSSASAS